MESPENETPTHQVSAFINKETCWASVEDPLHPPGCLDQTDRETFHQELEHYLTRLDFPTVHCCIKKRIGERISFSTTGHSYSGGFAVTKVETVNSDSELDGTSLFDSSTLTSVPHAIKHVFSVVQRYPSANLADGIRRAMFMTDDFNEQPSAMEVNSELPQSSDAHAVPHLPAITQVRTRNPRMKQPRNRERGPKLSQEQLLANAIRLHTRRTAFLSHISDSNPYIRSHHIVTKNRTLAFVSALFSSERNTNPRAVPSVLWETKK